MKSNRKKSTVRKIPTVKHEPLPELPYGLQSSGVAHVDLLCRRLLANVMNEEMDIVSIVSLCLSAGMTRFQFDWYCERYEVARETLKIARDVMGERREREIRKFNAPIGMMFVLPRYNHEYTGMKEQEHQRQIEMANIREEAKAVAALNAPVQLEGRTEIQPVTRIFHKEKK